MRSLAMLAALAMIVGMSAQAAAAPDLSVPLLDPGSWGLYCIALWPYSLACDLVLGALRSLPLWLS
jgi:hypothetical protein